MELQQTHLSNSFRFDQVLVLIDHQNRPFNHRVGDRESEHTGDRTRRGLDGDAGPFQARWEGCHRVFQHLPPNKGRRPKR
jgi:hypothetical protein